MSTTTDYSRISISSKDDIEKLYLLLKTYAQHPFRAKTVSEVIIDAKNWSPRWTNCRPRKHKADDVPLEHRIRDEAHFALQEYIHGLALPKDTIADFVAAVDQKRREVMGWSVCDGDSKCGSLSFETVGIALLLSFCENISTLYLAEGLLKSDAVEYMLKTNYGEIKNPGLQKLKHVYFMTSSDTMSDLVDSLEYGKLEILRYMQLVHRFPALESVAMDALQEYHRPDYRFFVPHSGNMKKLEITHCDIPSESLARMISIPKFLEEFKLSVGGLRTTDEVSPLVQSSQIGKALAVHRDTLRVVDVDIDVALDRTADYPISEDNDEDEDEDEEERACRTARGRNGGSYGRERLAADKAISVHPKVTGEVAKEHGDAIGSFNDFPRLTHLSISIMALFGAGGNDQSEPPFKLVECLPPSLEYFCLYGYVRGVNPDDDEHIDEFLAKKREKLPKLKVVQGIEELVPGLKDVYGNSGSLQEEEVYAREEVERVWKEVEV
ncbi:hypothetical protein ACHAO9_010546 [Fusarium lateritium]